MYVWTLAIAVLLAVDIAALPQDAFQVTKECEVRDVIGAITITLAM